MTINLAKKHQKARSYNNTFSVSHVLHQFKICSVSKPKTSNEIR